MALDSRADQQLALLQGVFNEVAGRAAAGMATNPFASIVDGRLSLKRKDELEVTPDIVKMRELVHGALGPVRIENLLHHVDAWTHFSSHLAPLSGYSPRHALSSEALLAAVVAHGTNLGIAMMGQSAEGVSVEMLNLATRWYLREATLKAANAALVDFHHRLDLAKVYGDGTSSSSDGQRFAIRGEGMLGSFYPRYFGYYERVVALYTHTSDQHAVFSTQVISCEPRESLYLLDGLLDHDTVLKLRFHTSDTHGYTEHIL